MFRQRLVLREGVENLLECEHAEGGDEHRIGFHEATVFVHPRTIFTLDGEHLGGKVATPINFLAVVELELVDVGRGQRFGHSLEIVEEALHAESGIFLKCVVVPEPLFYGDHPWVVGTDLGVDE